MKRLAWLALVLASTAAAQNTVNFGDPRLAPMDDPLRVVFQPGTEPPSQDRLRQTIAIIVASRGWRVESENASGWDLVREVRGKHTARTKLACERGGCALRYVDSEHLLYRELVVSGTPLRLIHRNYNSWARDLMSSLAGGLGVPAQVSSGFASISAVDAVPFLDAAGRQAYREFLQSRRPRVFAVAPNGAWGSNTSSAASGPPPSFFNANVQEPLSLALRSCNQRGANACRIYAVDDRVVWDEAAGAAPRVAPVIACTPDAGAPHALAGGLLPAPGDCWVYKLEGKRGAVRTQRTYVVTVASASREGIVDQASIDDSSLPETRHARGPYLIAQGASVFSPYLGAFQDLASGASLSGVKVIDPEACKPPYGCEVKARVVGRETIQVPAGKFDAVKVVVQHDWYPVSIQPGGSSQNNELWGSRTLTVWYSPEAKRAVRFSSRLENGLSPPVESDFELVLVAYRLH